MFTLRTSGCRWRPNFGARSTIATDLPNRYGRNEVVSIKSGEVNRKSLGRRTGL